MLGEQKSKGNFSIAHFNISHNRKTLDLIFFKVVSEDTSIKINSRKMMYVYRCNYNFLNRKINVKKGQRANNVEYIVK